MCVCVYVATYISISKFDVATMQQCTDPSLNAAISKPPSDIDALPQESEVLAYHIHNTPAYSVDAHYMKILGWLSCLSACRDGFMRRVLTQEVLVGR